MMFSLLLQHPPPDLVASRVAGCTSSGNKKEKKKKMQGKKKRLHFRSNSSGTVGSPCRGKAELLPGHMLHGAPRGGGRGREGGDVKSKNSTLVEKQGGCLIKVPPGREGVGPVPAQRSLSCSRPVSQSGGGRGGASWSAGPVVWSAAVHCCYIHRVTAFANRGM